MSQRTACALLGIVETDTLQVEYEGHPRLIRLIDIATEHAKPGGTEPPTDFGRQTLAYLQQSIFKDAVQIELLFSSSNIPVSDTNKLLAHVFVGGESLNLRLIREGYSPCYVKYGFPVICRAAMEQAELWARLEGRGLWGGYRAKEYEALKQYWRLRAGQVEDFRHAAAMGEDIFDVRIDYHHIVSRAKAGGPAVLFGDFARSYALSDGGLLIQIGSPLRPFCALVPARCRGLGSFLDRTFIGFCKPNYAFLSGRLTMAEDQPQIVIESLEQVTTYPPRAE